MIMMLISLERTYARNPSFLLQLFVEFWKAKSLRDLSRPTSINALPPLLEVFGLLTHDSSIFGTILEETNKIVNFLRLYQSGLKKAILDLQDDA